MQATSDYQEVNDSEILDVFTKQSEELNQKLYYAQQSLNEHARMNYLLGQENASLRRFATAWQKEVVEMRLENERLKMELEETFNSKQNYLGNFTSSSG